MFLIFALNIDRGYKLEPPNEGKSKKIIYTHVNHNFTLYKNGVLGGVHYMDMFA